MKIRCTKFWCACVMAAVVVSAPGPAQAAICDTLTTGGGGDVIILGETTTEVYSALIGWYYIPTGELAVCHDGSYEEYPDCDTSTSSSDDFKVVTGAGDDLLGPNETTESCEGGHDTVMYPFDSTFDFGLTAWMGTGSDTVYGTLNGDYLLSNTVDHSGYPADSAEDILCGNAGTDTLVGDEDDTNTYEEILHGGTGSGDVCHGGDSGSTYDWGHNSCEYVWFAWSTSTDYGDCDDPIDLWSLM